MIAMCWKCSRRVIADPGPDSIHHRMGAKELVGCKDLTKEQWEEGRDSLLVQKNCPLFNKEEDDE